MSDWSRSHQHLRHFCQQVHVEHARHDLAFPGKVLQACKPRWSPRALVLDQVQHVQRLRDANMQLLLRVHVPRARHAAGGIKASK